MTWLQPINDRDEITPEDFVKKLGGYLLESQSVVAYHGWIETLGVSLEDEEVI